MKLTARGAAAAAALLAALVCLPALRGGFVIDDAYLVVDNVALRSVGNVPTFFASAWGGGVGGAAHAGVNAAYYRPLTMTVQAVEYAAFGLAPAGWHLISLLLHAAASALVTVLAIQLLRGPPAQGASSVALAAPARVAPVTVRGTETGAAAGLLAGAIFAVHPVHSEAVAAICYQTTLLTAVLALVALVLVGRMLERGVTAGRVAAVVLATVAAVLAKEDAATVPLLAATWVLLRRGDGWRRVLLAGPGAMALATAAFLLVRASVVTSSSVAYFEGASSGVVALTMLRVGWLYAGLLVLPLRLCPFYDWFIVPPETGLSAEVFLGGCALLLLLGTAALVARRAPGSAIGLLWLPLGLLPVLHLVPILNVAAERFLYLPSVGMAVATAAGAAAVLRRVWRTAAFSPAVGVMLGCVLLLGARTLVRWPDWRDDRSLNQSTAAQFPETPTPLLNLAELAAAGGRTDEAIRLVEEARRRTPGWPVPERMLRELRAYGRAN